MPNHLGLGTCAAVGNSAGLLSTEGAGVGQVKLHPVASSQSVIVRSMVSLASTALPVESYDHFSGFLRKYHVRRSGSEVLGETNSSPIIRMYTA